MSRRAPVTGPARSLPPGRARSLPGKGKGELRPVPPLRDSGNLTAESPFLPRTRAAWFCLTGCELLVLKCSVFFPFSNWDEPFVTVFKLGPQVSSAGEKVACIYPVELDFSACIVT